MPSPVLLAGATAATAQAPERPAGHFGGGALVAPPKNLFGAGNAVIALRALDKGRLEIEGDGGAKGRVRGRGRRAPDERWQNSALA